MNGKLLILYGTLTMNTEVVASKIFDVVNALGIFDKVELKNMYDIDNPSELENYDTFIIGTSTWDDGDFPPDGVEFYDKILVNPPNLEGKTAAFFGLGESYYEFFCTSAEKIRDYFIDELKVNQIGDLKKIDGYPEEQILDEVEAWIKKILGH